MNEFKSLTTAALCICCVAVLAAPARAGEDMSGFMSDTIGNVEFTGGRIVELAEAIPAEHYSWRPSDEVRTVSEVFMHIAGVNLLLPSTLGADLPQGVEVPEEGPFALLGQWEAEVTEKDAVIAKLKDSFAYAAAALPTITDLDTEVTIFTPEPQTKRAYVLILMSHAHEHLGQSIAYARSIGVVPPWTAAQQAAAAEAAAEEDAEAAEEMAEGSES